MKKAVFGLALVASGLLFTWQPARALTESCFTKCTRALGQCNKGCREGDHACYNRCTPGYASCLKCCK